MNRIDKILENIVADKKSHFRVFLLVLTLMTVFMYIVYGAVYDHPGYDYYFHLKRFEALITAIREGTYPIYIDHAAALNYGYLSKMFYSDTILVPFALLGLLVEAPVAYEVMLVTMTILSGVFMYKVVETVYKGSFVPFITSILYTFSVYRLFDIYNRGALGEVFAFTFIPIVFWGLYHIIKGDYKKWYIIAIGFTLLIFSHVISTVLTFLTVVALLIIYYKPLIKEPKRIWLLLLAGGVTLLLTISYILPMWEQVQSNTFRYESNDWTLPSRSKLPFSYVLWGLLCGFVYPKNIIIVGTGILLTLAVFFRFWVKEKSEKLRSVDIGVLIGIFYIIASSSIFPWGRFPFTLLSFIQYPSRLYLFVTLFFAIAAGYYLSRIFVKRNARIVVVGIVLLLTCGIMVFHNDNYKYMYTEHIKTSNIEPTPGNFFYLNGAEYVPDKVPSGYYIQSRGDSIVCANMNAEIVGYERDMNILSVDIVTPFPDVLELPLFYYKGYRAELNDVEIEVSESENGLVQIPVDKSGNVKVYYNGTATQKISWYISIIGIFVLCIYIFVNRKQEHTKID